MATFFFRLLIALSVSSALLAGLAEAKKADGVEKAVKVKKQRVKRSTVDVYGDERYLHGSKETQNMRDNRLSRECRGAANGGACRGYTR